MSLSLYKRPTGIFHLRGTVQGYQVDQSTRTRSRSEAEAIRAKVSSELFSRAIYGTKAVATFADAVVAYLQSGGSPDHLDPLIARIGATRLSQIDQILVDSLARELKPTAAPATLIRQIYTPISAVMNYAAMSRLCEPFRLRKPKVKNGRTEFLTPDEVENWLEALPPHLSRIITFYVGTGCRASEGLRLNWTDVSPGNSRAVIWETKADYPRGVDLPSRVREQLPSRPSERTQAVFLNSKGEPWHAYDAINLMLKRARERREREIAKGSMLPELRPLHCHLLRHTWATWAYACTRDLAYLMQTGGWRSATMVMRYSHVASPDLAEAVLERGWEFAGRELWMGSKLRGSSIGSAPAH